MKTNSSTNTTFILNAIAIASNLMCWFAKIMPKNQVATTIAYPTILV